MKRLYFGISLWGIAPALAVAAEGEANILQINWGLWIWTIATFLVMFAALVKLAFKPIAEALDRRGQTIKHALDDAEKSRAEAKAALDGYQEQLATARTEANQVIEDARVLSEKVRKEIADQATTEAAAMIQRAQEEIARQKEKGIEELKDTVAGLSVQIASKILEREVDEAVHRQLVENLIRDLSRQRKG